MEYRKRRIRIEAKKTVDSVLGNNRAFDLQVSLLKTIIYDDSPKEHMQKINGELEDNNFVIN